MRSEIIWPKEFHPDSTAVHVRNELEMAASPEAVWRWLIRAEFWPTWYVNARNVHIRQSGQGDVNAAAFLYWNLMPARYARSRGTHLRRGPAAELTAGSLFFWRTFGVAIESMVAEFVPNERIAWTAEGLGVHAYHAWLIERTPAGCRVLTEETQNGFVARLGSALMPNRMHKFHQIWLEALALRAGNDSPLSAA